VGGKGICPSLPTSLSPKRFGGFRRRFRNFRIPGTQPVGDAGADRESRDSDATPEHDLLDGAGGGNDGGDGGGFDFGLGFGVFGFDGTVVRFHDTDLLFWFWEISETK